MPLRSRLAHGKSRVQRRRVRCHKPAPRGEEGKGKKAMGRAWGGPSMGQGHGGGEGTGLGNWKVGMGSETWAAVQDLEPLTGA